MSLTNTKSTHQVRFIADSLLVYHPRYANDEKTRIRAIVRFNDGRLSEMEEDISNKRSPLIRDVLGQYTPEEIAALTERENYVLLEKQKVDQRTLEDKMLEEEREVTFQAKAKALAMPEIQNCKDKRIKQRIRKARSSFEIAAWISLALSESLKDE